jgi:hypothetical protein
MILGLTACEEGELTPSSIDELSRQQNERAFYAETSPENVSYGLDNYTLNGQSSGTHQAELAPLAGSPESGPEQQNVGAIPAGTLNVIRIDHFAGRSRLPDYSVTVRSDGLVIYEGRENVRVRGRQTFMMTDITVPVLKEIFDRKGFFHIVPDFVHHADMPYVVTSYQPTLLRKAKSTADNHSIPATLVGIRQEVETLLGIDRFVKEGLPDPELASIPQHN